MGHYFKPLRRKLGVLTLVIACVFMAGWVRSFSVRDRINLRKDRNTLYFLESNLSCLTWMVYHERRPMESEGFKWHWTLNAEPIDWFDGEGKEVSWHTQWRGFEFGNLKFASRHELDLWSVPYWSIVIPLTLLSAYLLLSKPRKLASKKMIEPVPDEGT